MINLILKAALSELDAAICVSNCNRENLSLRAKLSPHLIYTIPNSVDCDKFRPKDPIFKPRLLKPDGLVYVVMVCRLTLRKGIDLLVDILPKILRRHPEVRFRIGGDGNKRGILL